MDSQMIADLPPAQRLALAYAPARAKPAHLALLSLDRRLAGILQKRSEFLITQIKLAWWRDMLATPVDQWPAGDPVLELLRDWRDPPALVPLVDGWEAMVSEDLTPAAIADFVDGRGMAFAALARQLGTARPEDARAAGRIWALADLAANISDGEERQLVIEYGQTQPAPPRLPASLRPLAILAGLAGHALAQGGGDLLSGPRSGLLALRIGFTGR